ncbi:rRNA methyltransferase [Nannizzia gypsea CBS 118893]|uniref:rRNA methyltransferase 1, mitochondrial n=1 Tax=Arthroderma gypseum (strain ATCC MYA-4604 / CBS 118893) TaxID=535722 RepID=E5R2Z3_ARTGP|nr:rRNA methyltransferase [Nannizzia gypsea CBS 118893]EFQ97914.1 rRNA methyltransferase [Nannizzia gypsea CBS 118893]
MLLLSSRLTAFSPAHLHFQGLLGSQGANSIRHLSVNSAITAGIRKGRGFGAPKQNDGPWVRRGRISSPPRNSEKASQGYTLNKHGDNSYGPGASRTSNWRRYGEFDPSKMDDMTPGRANRLSRERNPLQSQNQYQESPDSSTPRRTPTDSPRRYQATKHGWGERRKPPTFVDNVGVRKLEASSVLSARQQMGGYAKSEDEVMDIHHPLSSKVYIVPPQQIPYSSPVSEFIYGTSAVNAAVRCGRRKLHTLYLFEESSRDRLGEPKWEQPEIRSIAKYASLAGAQVKHVTGPWKTTLDKMTGKRPHNGMVLEASPLPKPPVLGFQTVVSKSNSHFLAQLAPQPEEQAAVNGTDGHIQFDSRRKDSKASRFPFTLLLDGILDPGNLGAIFRSAYWFGADAIVFSSQNSAPISPVVMKAAAGATEAIPILSVRDVSTFMTASQTNGWKFFAADAPDATLANDYTRKIPVTKSLDSLSSELTKAPCVLMLGGEGSGLQQKIKNRADMFVTIPGAYSDNIRDDTAGVSSLNVSVASALLCEAFLSRRPASSVVETHNASDTPAENTNRVF